jgi:acid phosphatase type 7
MSIMILSLRAALQSRFGLICAAGRLALACSASAGEPPWISKGPYLQAPNPETMVVMWESLTNLPGTVHFGMNGKLNQKLDEIRPRKLKGVSSFSLTNLVTGQTNGTTFTKTNLTTHSTTNSFYVYEAALTPLKPGTSYSYEVEMGGAQTPARRFKTFAPEAKKTRFVVYGDTRSDPTVHAALAKRFREHKPEFILHTGDLVAKGKDYGLWAKEFFKPMAEVIKEVPFFSVIGNHEEDGTNYLAYFHLPGKELYYSLDVGPVHVLALDFHFEKSSSEQFLFASNDLATARAPWKIVVLHTPMHNIGGHISSWGHASYLPLFQQAKVDLVLAGHSHLYERFRPLAPRGEKDWAITHITTGGGGANLHPSFDHPSLLARETTNHYMLFDATPDTLQAKTIRANGSVLDRFKLTKRDGRMPTKYLAQVYPEESMELFYDAVPNLVGRVAALPTAHSSAPVMLNLTPRKKASTPAEMEITLAPESVPYYVLVNGPLRVVSPPKGQTNLVLWASVRPTGRKPITENKDHQLIPPLVLMAKVKAGGEATIAYGGRCRLSTTATDAAKKR